MQPLQDLVHRIKGTTSSAKETFSFPDENGIVHHIPLHRVRTVYKDGVVMWLRPGHPAGD
jgi:hypothetical protein